MFLLKCPFWTLFTLCPKWTLPSIDFNKSYFEIRAVKNYTMKKLFLVLLILVSRFSEAQVYPNIDWIKYYVADN